MHLKRKKVKMFRIFFKKPLAAHTYNTSQNQIVFQVAIDSLSCCNVIVGGSIFKKCCSEIFAKFDKRVGPAETLFYSFF